MGDAIGRDAHGRVFRGTWEQQAVALKLVAMDDEEGEESGHVEECDDDGATLQWEVGRLAGMDHPNLLQFHGLCIGNGRTCLVMEWREHGDLESVLEEGDPGIARLWQWMLQISQGLAHLHGQNMPHRDLKAAYVLIDAHGRAKLADWGVAQVDALPEGAELDDVQPGTQTSGLGAPENIRGNQARCSRKAADVHALGLLFWRMVYQGAVPASWPPAAHGQSLRQRIADTSPPAFQALLLACCDPDPQQRATIEQVQQQLQDLGPGLHPDHALVRLAEHLELAMHEQREAARHYVPLQVTARRVGVDIEHYWRIWEGPAEGIASSAPTSTAHTAPGVASAIFDAPRTTAQPAPAISSVAPERADDGVVRANPPLSLQSRFDAFLDAPDCDSLLLLGAAGLGKTLGVHVLAGQILQRWRQHWSDPGRYPRPSWMPIFLRRHVAGWSEADLKAAYARIAHQLGLQPGQVKPLVFVDGYDECRMESERPGKLAEHLGLPQGAKLIVSCRPDTVPEGEWRARFGFAHGLQPVHVLPLKDTQVLAYLKQQLAWDEQAGASLLAQLERKSALRDVLRNPFVLSLLVQGWDAMRDKPLEQLTRSGIHAGYIAHMVDRGRGQLAAAVQQRLQAGHADLAASFQAFAWQLALKACQARGMTLDMAAAHGMPSAWSGLQDLVRQEARQRHAQRLQLHARSDGASAKKEPGRRMALTEEDFVQMQEHAASQMAARLPLRQRGGRYEFVHRSMFEYCLAQQLLRLMNEEAQDMTEEAFEALLAWAQESFPDALMFVHEALRIAGQRKHGSTLKISSDLRAASGRCKKAWLRICVGRVLQERGRHAEALDCYRKALALQEKVLGEGHVATATSYSAIGSALLAQGQPSRSLDAYRAALEIREKVLGAGHVDTAVCYNNIGLALQDQGQYALALDFLGKALAIREQVLGAGHVGTAISYHHIGAVLEEQGQPAPALEHYRKALAIREKALGAEHVDTAQSHSSIGSALQDQGQFAQAVDHYRKALAIREKMLGAGHVATVILHNNLGSALQDQGEPAQALDCYLKALAIQEQVLGAGHIDTATSCNNMGSVLKAQGQLEQALACHRKALAIRENALGIRHLDTASSYNNIGSVLHAQGDHARALEYFRKALAIQAQEVGAGHVAIAASYNNIGLALHAQGRPVRALDYLGKALAMQVQVLGAGHPVTATSYHNIGAVLKAQGEYARALEHFGKALAIRERVLGAAHVDTVALYKDIDAVRQVQRQHGQAASECEVM